MLRWPCTCRFLSNCSTTTAADSATRDLFAQLRHGQRHALARAITLVESTLPAHRQQARQLLSLIASSSASSQHRTKTMTKTVQQQRQHRHTVRIGLSGPPGVGKSTFLEVFGMHLIGLGHRVAVLAVDPSSSKSGGSILGDKTRMVNLSRDENAYVRPSPSRGSLGGVARNTMEGILLCETAGYDVVLIETVGVGQSETMVSEMVDIFTLLVPPAGGDELQGIKRGIVELADVIVVNKADGDLLVAARQAQIEYTSAMKFVQPRFRSWKVPVIGVSSKEGKGMTEVWDAISGLHARLVESGELAKLRNQQKISWMWNQIRNGVMDQLLANPQITGLIGDLEAEIRMGAVTPSTAADTVLETIRHDMK